MNMYVVWIHVGMEFMHVQERGFRAYLRIPCIKVKSCIWGGKKKDKCLCMLLSYLSAYYSSNVIVDLQIYLRDCFVEDIMNGDPLSFDQCLQEFWEWLYCSRLWFCSSIGFKISNIVIVIVLYHYWVDLEVLEEPQENDMWYS